MPAIMVSLNGKTPLSEALESSSACAAPLAPNSAVAAITATPIAILFLDDIQKPSHRHGVICVVAAIKSNQPTRAESNTSHHQYISVQFSIARRVICKPDNNSE